MWYSPTLLEEYSRERVKSLSRHLDACRLAEECKGRSPPRWRRFLARFLAAMSLHIDQSTARSTLEARFFSR
jgi:hypothetical protein